MTEAPSLVVFAVGNESRGDDALGPLFLRAVGPRLPSGTRVVHDFQLQVEHALDLGAAGLALFVDAECGLAAPFAFREIASGAVPCAFSHALAPEAVLEVFARVEGRLPPPAFVLGLRAERFELGEGPSPRAGDALEAALCFADGLFAAPAADVWRGLAQALSAPAGQERTAPRSSRG